MALRCSTRGRGCSRLLLLCACLTSVWKVDLRSGGQRLRRSPCRTRPSLMSLLLLGPAPATIIAVAGAWTQCTFNVKQRYPLVSHRVQHGDASHHDRATGAGVRWLGGPLAPADFATLSEGRSSARSSCISSSTRSSSAARSRCPPGTSWTVWRDDFLWSGVSFMVAAPPARCRGRDRARRTSGSAMLMLAPVYLTYWTYQLFVRRLEDETRHVAETRRLHAGRRSKRCEGAPGRAGADRREGAARRDAAQRRRRRDPTDLEGRHPVDEPGGRGADRLDSGRGDRRTLGEVFQNFDPETWQRCDNSIEALTSDPQRTTCGRRSIVLAARRSDRASDRGERRADSRRRRAGDRHRPRLSRHHRRAQDAGGTREGEQARVARVAGRRHGARLQQHPDGGHGQRVDGAGDHVAAAGDAGLGSAKPSRPASAPGSLTWQLLTFSKGGVPARKTVALGPMLQEVGRARDSAASASAARWTIPADSWRVEADGASSSRPSAT